MRGNGRIWAAWLLTALPWLARCDLADQLKHVGPTAGSLAD